MTASNIKTILTGAVASIAALYAVVLYVLGTSALANALFQDGYARLSFILITSLAIFLSLIHVSDKE